MLKKKHSVDRDWDFLSDKEVNQFLKIHSNIWLKSELARGGFWGVREAKKLSFDAEKAKFKFFNNIYKTRPWFQGKDLRIELHEAKVFAFNRPQIPEMSGKYGS